MKIKIDFATAWAFIAAVLCLVGVAGVASMQPRYLFALIPGAIMFAFTVYANFYHEK